MTVRGPGPLTVGAGERSTPDMRGGPPLSAAHIRSTPQPALSGSGSRWCMPGCTAATANRRRPDASKAPAHSLTHSLRSLEGAFLSFSPDRRIQPAVQPSSHGKQHLAAERFPVNSCLAAGLRLPALERFNRGDIRPAVVAPIIALRRRERPPEQLEDQVILRARCRYLPRCNSDASKARRSV